MRTRLASTACVGLLAAGLLIGCSSPRPRQPQVDPDELRRFALRSYQPSGSQATEEISDVWQFDGADVAVLLTLPRASGRYPLVVYLPGMGESDRGGRQWRDTWAQAGYAVLSLQTYAAGHDIRLSPRARNGEFADLARQAFSPTALAQRLRATRQAIAEVRRRAMTQQPYNRIDTTRFAIAGYDLGAQTAQAFAGEPVDTSPTVREQPSPAATILFSPYANLAEGGFEQRFAALQGPLLSITGSNDTDAWGLVTTAIWRQAPFRYAPSPRKFLVSFEAAGHAVFAGSADPAKADAETGDAAEPGERGAPAEGKGPEGGGHRRGGHARGKGSHDDAPGFTGGPGRRADPQHLTIAAQRLSLAFLDATLKDDAIALEWLKRDAGRWLGALASFDAR